jgi:ADP-ribose pyrophosphatase YjhB (NUDIX family)
MNYVEEIRQIVGHRPLILAGSVTVVIDDSNNILLQKRKSTSYGMWGLPGGLMELGESTEDTARREVYEETGLIIGKLNLIDVFSGRDNYLKIPNGDECYLVTVAYYTWDVTGEIKIDEKESLELNFVPIDNLPDNIVKSHKKIIDRFIESKVIKLTPYNL